MSDIDRSHRHLILKEYVKLQHLKKEASFSVHDIMSGISNEFQSKFDANKPLSSLLQFVTSGFLWRYNKGYWIINEILEALGINLTKYLADFINDLAISATHKQLTIEHADQIAEQTSSHIASNISAEQIMDVLANDSKLMQVAKETGLGFKPKESLNTSHNILIKQAVGGWFLTPLKLIFKAISFLAVPVLVAGASKGILGASSSSDKNKISGEITSPSVITISPADNLDSDFISKHTNSGTYYWTEKFDSKQIPNVLIEWALGVYPKMEKFKSEFYKSNAFRQVVKQFINYNEGNVGFTLIPRPYTSKMEIVNLFIQDVVNNIKSKLKPKSPAKKPT